MMKSNEMREMGGVANGTSSDTSNGLSTNGTSSNGPETNGTDSTGKSNLSNTSRINVHQEVGWQGGNSSSIVGPAIAAVTIENSNNSRVFTKVSDNAEISAKIKKIQSRHWTYYILSVLCFCPGCSCFCLTPAFCCLAGLVSQFSTEDNPFVLQQKIDRVRRWHPCLGATACGLHLPWILFLLVIAANNTTMIRLSDFELAVKMTDVYYDEVIRSRYASASPPGSLDGISSDSSFSGNNQDTGRWLQDGGWKTYKGLIGPTGFAGASTEISTKYYRFLRSMDRNAAAGNHTCQQFENGKLAEIWNDDIDTFIRNNVLPTDGAWEMAYVGGVRSFFTGLFRWGSVSENGAVGGEFVGNTTAIQHFINITDTKWASGNPVLNMWACMGYARSDKKWHSTNCESPISVICESTDNSFNGNLSGYDDSGGYGQSFHLGEHAATATDTDTAATDGNTRTRGENGDPGDLSARGRGGQESSGSTNSGSSGSGTTNRGSSSILENLFGIQVHVQNWATFQGHRVDFPRLAIYASSVNILESFDASRIVDNTNTDGDRCFDLAEHIVDAEVYVWQCTSQVPFLPSSQRFSITSEGYISTKGLFKPDAFSLFWGFRERDGHIILVKKDDRRILRLPRMDRIKRKTDAEGVFWTISHTINMLVSVAILYVVIKETKELDHIYRWTERIAKENSDRIYQQNIQNLPNPQARVHPSVHRDTTLVEGMPVSGVASGMPATMNIPGMVSPSIRSPLSGNRSSSPNGQNQLSLHGGRQTGSDKAANGKGVSSDNAMSSGAIVVRGNPVLSPHGNVGLSPAIPRLVGTPMATAVGTAMFPASTSPTGVLASTSPTGGVRGTPALENTGNSGFEQSLVPAVAQPLPVAQPSAVAQPLDDDPGSIIGMEEEPRSLATIQEPANRPLQTE